MLINAREACRRLGVKPATLYAYVSRGLIQSSLTPGSRERRYRADEVERLKRLRHTGRAQSLALRPFDADLPVLDSALCLVEDGRYYYRGLDATKLAATADLEGIARLLWGVGSGSDPFAKVALPPGMAKMLRGLPPASAPIERARAMLVRLAESDLKAVDTEAGAVIQTGARLLSALVAAISGGGFREGVRITPSQALPGEIAGEVPAHLALAGAWKLDRSGADLVRRFLVLIADHELNVSTYVARSVASAGATPYAVVIAALGALSGPRHGGATASAEALIAELIRSPDPGAALAERLRRGESVPGFGHPLYPAGDPRAKAVLDALAVGPQGPRVQRVNRLRGVVARYVAKPPNVDFAGAAVASALGLPRGAALGLFLIGRSVGWIAHAIEQYATGQLIRPRARYVGVLPGEAASAVSA
ncbi:MAG: MerR family transcriptional regulator [Proteobacteria bacterium]|nr:MerR family transcriptional regulator [Pseudomonadota bacterium]MBI3500109.1 MerR family transcriptional regulator [Pseudomonadota bacterium]